MPLLWLVCCLYPTAAQQLTVEGIAKMRAYRPWGETQEQARVKFRIQIDGCNWIVNFVRDEGSRMPCEASFDGESVYYLSDMKREIEQQRREGLATAANVANATVYPGQVPNFLTCQEIGVIWLTYASGCYFKSHTNGMVESPEPYGIPEPSYGAAARRSVRAKWALSDSQPPFPVRVEYLSDGLVRGPQQLVRLAPPFDTGFTSAVYQVTAFTNLSGLALPLSSSFRTFRPSRVPERQGSLDVGIEFTVTLTNARAVCTAASFQPRLPGVTHVRDDRYSNVTHHYFATNAWPSTRSLHTDPYFAEFRRVNGYAADRPRGLRGLSEAFLALLRSPRSWAGSSPEMAGVLLVLFAAGGLVVWLRPRNRR